MKDLCLPHREGDGLRQAHRPTKTVHHRKVLTVFSTLRVGPLDERKARRLRGPGFGSEPQAPFSHFILWGRTHR
jgi:hypothetical protein